MCSSDLKIKEELWVIHDKNIAVLGVSFKPNTDDMREAPSLEIIAELKQYGAKVRVYDPQALVKVKEILEEKQTQDVYDLKVYETLNDVMICDSPEQAIENADCMLLITEWDEFKQMPLDKIKGLMRQPLVIDGRNVFDPEEMEKLGFIYRSVGR